MRIPTRLKEFVFFQNGGTDSKHSLSGQGHITAIDLSTATVSEHHVPQPPHAIELDDIVTRNWPKLLATLLFAFESAHTGTGNTAVVSRGGVLFALEEGSRPYKLHFDGRRLCGGEWTSASPQCVHFHGDDSYTYRPLRDARPLTFNGVTIDWSPRHPPPLMHSYARINESCVMFPVTSARIGRFAEWFWGKLRLPVYAAARFSWLVCNTDDGSSLIVESNRTSDPLHVLTAKTDESGRVHIFSVSVLNFSDFLQGQDTAVLGFELHKDVIDLDRAEIVETRSYNVSGDFPNHVGGGVFLLTDIQQSRVHFFDTEREEVVHSVALPTRAHDVQFRAGYLMYCTRAEFLVVDAGDGGLVYAAPIPARQQNFHSSLISARDVAPSGAPPGRASRGSCCATG